ncbi:hypothetical protein KQX54_010400 [Cotesia glomerata]|uniref:Uncharacterized protein n=1 Tax=Cotesia glomerata TaxID=32391 RepID=A0AAV7ID33_COTGL|nr:hypothetical protein KQX54_010400 [Cotesia glomerata]
MKTSVTMVTRRREEERPRVSGGVRSAGGGPGGRRGVVVFAESPVSSLAGVQRGYGPSEEGVLRVRLSSSGSRHGNYRCDVLDSPSSSRSNEFIDIPYSSDRVGVVSVGVGRTSIVNRGLPGVVPSARGLAGSPGDDEVSGGWSDLRRHPPERLRHGAGGGSSFGTERLLLDSDDEEEEEEDEELLDEYQEDHAEKEKFHPGEHLEVEAEEKQPAMSRQSNRTTERDFRERDFREQRGDIRDRGAASAPSGDHRPLIDEHLPRRQHRDRDRDADYDYEHSATAATASSTHTNNPNVGQCISLMEHWRCAPALLAGCSYPPEQWSKGTGLVLRLFVDGRTASGFPLSHGFI